MEAFPQSAIGLPSSMKYDLPPSLSDSARAYGVAVAPDGISVVTGTSIGNPFVASQGAASLSNFVQTLTFFSFLLKMQKFYLCNKRCLQSTSFKLTTNLKKEKKITYDSKQKSYRVD